MIHGAVSDSSFLQFQQGDFGGAIEADGGRDEADAAVDEHVDITAREQTVGVFLSESGRNDWRTEERYDDLAAVSVAGEDQMRAGAGPILERIGVVHQGERERRIDALEGAPDVGAFGPVIADPDDGKGFAIDADHSVGIAQDGDAGGFDGPGDGVAIVPIVVIAEAGEHAVFGAGLAHAAGAIVKHLGLWRAFFEQGLDQSREARVAIRDGAGHGHVIAGENHEVGRESIGHRDGFGNVICANRVTAMEIGQMGDGEALKRAWKSLNGNCEATDMGEAGFDVPRVDNAADTEGGG